MELDKVVTDHSQENLESLFSAKLVAELPFFSILVKETTIPWIVFIPKRPMSDTSTLLLMYGQMHKLAEGLQAVGRGHFNLAKIGNKSPWLHFHLVFRSETDEAWPDAIWCHEPLEENQRQATALIKQIKTIMQDSDSTAL